MVETPSLSGEEQQLSRFLEIEMKKQGFQTIIDSTGNVICRTGEGDPKILLCGHMDTVQGNIPVRLDDGILHGRGAVDAKGPLAAMIVAASQLKDEGYKGTLTVAGVIDEEGRNSGISGLLESNIDYDFAVFGEPTNVETITVGYKGHLLMNISVHTETGHSSAPWLFRNAIEEVTHIWNMIKAYGEHPEKDESAFNLVTANLRKIEGGTNSGTVPGDSSIIVELRVPPTTTVKELREKIFTGVEVFRSENSDIDVSVEVIDSVEPYLADIRSKLVKAFTRSIWTNHHTRVKLVKKTGTGDMNFFGANRKTPTITYGPGDPHLDHTPHEHIVIDDYLASIKVIKDALRNLSTQR